MPVVLAFCKQRNNFLSFVFFLKMPTTYYLFKFFGIPTIYLYFEKNATFYSYCTLRKEGSDKCMLSWKIYYSCFLFTVCSINYAHMCMKCDIKSKI